MLAICDTLKCEILKTKTGDDYLTLPRILTCANRRHDIGKALEESRLCVSVDGDDAGAGA